MDYEKIGLKVGLEIHQQLATSTKLFCNCRPELFKEEPRITFLRRLRPTQSELGQVDPAAYFEFQKGVKILYETNTETACLVEMDDEPPHQLNMEAVETVLTAALMMKAKPVDEIHIMRKTVIDGSNTTGFQRTCVVALNGEIEVDEKKIPIQHASLEEDAARKMGEDEGNTIRFRIDRLGIPLIEVATAPVIKSPKEAEEVAFAIGNVLRATGKVMRGLGTIRQDLNISISDGALNEIKGVQELELISQAVKYEVQRQLNLIRTKKELEEKGAQEEEITEEFFNVTDVFKQTKCKVIRKAIDKDHQVLALKLPKFRGFLKQELLPNIRLGTEMADRAKFWGRVDGIFHTDEMPAYGITQEEIETLKNVVKAEKNDAIVFVADTLENAHDALKAIVERARETLRGVPEETRVAKSDGTTRFMRPRPGAARMYPETDIPPVPITEEMVKKISSCSLELPEQKLERLMKEYSVNLKLAKQVLDSEYCELFEIIAEESNVLPTTVAAFLTESVKALKRDGVKTDAISDGQMREIFKLVGSGDLAKEAIPDVAVWLSAHEGKSAKEAVEMLGLKSVSESELEMWVEKIIAENKELVKQRREGSFGVLMGIIMKNMRGKIDAASVSRILKKKLEDVLK